MASQWYLNGICVIFRGQVLVLLRQYMDDLRMQLKAAEGPWQAFDKENQWICTIWVWYPP